MSRQTTIAGVTYDNSLIVACHVYDCQMKGERVWFTKIVENFKLLDKWQISHAIDECFDWGILYGEYGETVPGRGGRLLMVDHDAKMIIDPIWCKLYEI
ncbi:MAG: hypothetical protein WC877_01125 [Dehalococcoidales bacterium]